MTVLGLDPGTATTGFGVVQLKGTRLHHVAHGTIQTAAGLSFEARLREIYDEATALIRNHKPAVVAIEKLYFVQNITNGISVAQARGVLALAAANARLPVTEYSPTEVKKAVVGVGQARKNQVQEMVRRLLNLESPPRPDDAADALALAITQLHVGATGYYAQEAL